MGVRFGVDVNDDGCSGDGDGDGGGGGSFTGRDDCNLRRVHG